MFEKILPVSDLEAWANIQRRGGRKIVHCHGVFDILHPGHLEHLRQASEIADVLVVTVTSDEFVDKGPGRPYLSAGQRAEVLAALEVVDAVSISQAANSVEVISALKPDFYVKGPDYQRPEMDPTGNMALEIEAVVEHGGQLRVTSGAMMSSSSLRNQMLMTSDDAKASFLNKFQSCFGPEDVHDLFEQMSKLNVLVVGETIIDKYVTCEALGKTSKDPVLAFKPIDFESQLGGVLAIARHLAGLETNVTVLTRVGRSDGWAGRIQQSLDNKVNLKLIESDDEPTIVKTRYVDLHSGNKVFETYEIGDSVSSESDSSLFAGELENLVEKCDLVVVADYGHGLLDKKAVEVITSSKTMTAVNTQSNAGNRGFNSISKYPRVDIVCLNGSEVALELRERHLEIEFLIPDLMNRTRAKFIAVTSGAKGVTYAFESSGKQMVESIPAFATKVTDRVGAGDALFAATSAALAAGGHPMLSALVGNLAGAASIAELGNRTSVDRVSLTRHVLALLK